MDNLKQYIIMIGNPGSGKSTFLNMLCKQRVFESGVSVLNGLTSVFQLKEVDGVNYGDTPGLDDFTNRKSAAEEIGKVLKQNGKYKLFFMITLESGRVKPNDVTTMRLVLEAIKVKVPFGVIFNKLTGPLYNLLQNKEELDKIGGALYRATNMITPYYHLLKKDDELEDLDNVVPKWDQDFATFIHRVPYHIVLPENVEDIKYNEWDEVVKTLEDQLTKLGKDKEELGRAVIQMKEQMDKEAAEYKANFKAMQAETMQQLAVLEQRHKEEVDRLHAAQASRDKERAEMHQQVITSMNQQIALLHQMASQRNDGGESCILF